MNLNLKLGISTTLIFLFVCSVVYSQVSVKGYYRKDGTYVRPHMRSNPDGNPYNNWSYPGNTNPYTGKVATGNPETYLKNYYDNNSGLSKTSNSYWTYTTFDWNKAKKESERFWKEEYPKIRMESEATFAKLRIASNYSSANEKAINYHYRYTIEERLLIELALEKLGFPPGESDGFFDSRTINAIKRFQKSSGINADGKMGPVSLKRLIARLQ